MQIYVYSHISPQWSGISLWFLVVVGGAVLTPQLGYVVGGACSITSDLPDEEVQLQLEVSW